jgi:hypothetical protein
LSTKHTISHRVRQSKQLKQIVSIFSTSESQGRRQSNLLRVDSI